MQYSFQPTRKVEKAVHDISKLNRFMHNFIAICQGWKDKAVVVITEKNSTLQHLQTAIDKIKAMEEWEKQREEENFHLKAELELAQADHESAQANLESTHNDLEAASARATFYQAKEQALEEFRGSEDFKEEFVATSRLAYMIDYEDGRDAVSQFYPNLDVTRVPLPDFEEDQSVEDIPTDHVAPNEAAPIGEVASMIEPASAPGEKIVEPSPTEEEMASTMAIVNAVVVDD
ncbi:hypothetical protein COCNU_scaffold009120G000010 [Cocos nucifera]|nr:hypothetical protein [Cocos nucifera]